jgi:hypothetical protein
MSVLKETVPAAGVVTEVGVDGDDEADPVVVVETLFCVFVVSAITLLFFARSVK